MVNDNNDTTLISTEKTTFGPTATAEDFRIMENYFCPKIQQLNKDENFSLLDFLIHYSPLKRLKAFHIFRLSDPSSVLMTNP